MLQLLGDQPLEENIMKQLFLKRMPASTQAILASAPTLSTEELAKLADRILEVKPSQPFVSAMN